VQIVKFSSRRFSNCDLTRIAPSGQPHKLLRRVRLVLDEGKSVTAVAREFDLVASALGNWIKQAEADRSKGRTGLTTAEREELVRLRKALRIAEEERAS
jgi:transposase-like protein